MSLCQKCEAPIVWIRTPAGKTMPCDAKPVYIIPDETGPEKAVTKDGHVVSCRYTQDPDQAAVLGYVPHFATCKPPREQPQSVYTQDNPYGYRLNIAHPLVRPLYDRYKAWIGVGTNTPLSDRERFEFEEMVIPILERKAINCESDI